MKKIIFVSNESKDSGLKISFEILSKLVSMGFDVKTLRPIEGYITANEEDISIAELAVVLGGDGTIIKFARDYKEANLPIFGINLGRVGALAISELDNYESYLLKILNDDCYIENRMTLNVSVIRNNEVIVEDIALNELALMSKENKLVNLNVTVNDEFENNFFADGLLFATPTGSSAYNFSAHGPLLLVTNDSYVMTPVCPQFTAFTSVVLSKNDKVKAEVLADNIEFKCDGIVSIDTLKNDEIHVRYSDYKLKLISFNEKKPLYSSVYKVAMSIYK